MGNFIMSLLNAGTTWGTYFDEIFENDPDARAAMVKAFDITSTILWILLAIVGAVGSIYAIWLGIKLAKAEEQGKRDEAKKHLITVIIAVAVTLVLIIFFNVLLPMILKAFHNKGTADTGNIINLLTR